MKPILTVLLLILSSTVFGQWTKILEDQSRTIYYSSDRTKKEGQIVTTWVKSQPKGERVASLINYYKKAYPTYANEINKLSFIVQKDEYNCNKQVYRTIGIILYDKNLNVIVQNFEGEPSDWQEIPPGSIVEKIFQTICN